MATKKIAGRSPEELRQRWQDHIEWIGEEAHYMTGHRVRYRLIESWLIRRRGHKWQNRHFQAFAWISKLWFTEGLMSVRRQLDDQYGSISLKQLLHEIEARPEILGLSGVEVATDRKALEQACGGALPFAQRQLAHRVPWEDPFVSMRALDAALDSIDEVAHKYHLAITGRTLAIVESEPDPAWLQSFEVPWYRPRTRDRWRKMT